MIILSGTHFGERQEFQNEKVVEQIVSYSIFFSEMAYPNASILSSSFDTKLYIVISISMHFLTRSQCDQDLVVYLYIQSFLFETQQVQLQASPHNTWIFLYKNPIHFSQ
jgi:hypothetical protein